MKESKLLEMQNKIVALTNVMQQIINEISHLRELSVGTLETGLRRSYRTTQIKYIRKQRRREKVRSIII